MIIFDIENYTMFAKTASGKEMPYIELIFMSSSRMRYEIVF